MPKRVTRTRTQTGQGHDSADVDPERGVRKNTRRGLRQDSVESNERAKSRDGRRGTRKVTSQKGREGQLDPWSTIPQYAQLVVPLCVRGAPISFFLLTYTVLDLHIWPLTYVWPSLGTLSTVDEINDTQAQPNSSIIPASTHPITGRSVRLLILMFGLCGP